MKLLLNCFLIILIAISCKKPADDQENKGTTRVIINNFPDNADTININFHSYLKIRITGANYPKYIMKVTSMGFVSFYDSSYDGSFRIPTDWLCLYTGFYNCRFDFYGGQSSQTFHQIINNSVYINKRSVIIDFSGQTWLPTPVLAEKNGTLVGTYDTVLQIKALAVWKFYNYSSTYVRIDSLTVAGNGIFTFTDNSYVGERANYSMKGYSLTDSAGLAYSASGGADKQIEIVPQQIYSDANGLPVIKWNKNRYYQNFGSYRIHKQTSYGNNTLLKEITDINDTVVSDLDLGFPGAVSIYVTHLPKVNLQYIPPELETEDFGQLVTYQPGNPIHPFNEFESAIGNDVYLHKDNDTYLYRYSALTFQQTDSINCPTGRFSVSPNDKYVLTLLNDRFHLYNVSTRQDISILISDYLPVANVNEFDVSDNGTMVVMNSFTNLKLIDVIHNQLLGTLPMFNFTLNECQVSSTGEYIFAYTDDKPRIYRYSGGTFTQVYDTTDFAFNMMKFVADQPDKVLLFLRTGYELYNLVTGNVEVNVPLGLGQDISIDFNNYLILSEEGNFYKVYDIYTGTVVKSIVNNFDYSNIQYSFLHRHTMFNGDGRQMTFREK